jgi:hypothetical protein
MRPVVSPLRLVNDAALSCFRERNQVEPSVQEERTVKLPRDGLHIGFFQDELVGVLPVIEPRSLFLADVELLRGSGFRRLSIRRLNEPEKLRAVAEN